MKKRLNYSLLCIFMYSFSFAATPINSIGLVINSTTPLSTPNVNNSATVTNGIYSTGSYANPSWITSIASSKITGILPYANGGTNASTAWTPGNVCFFGSSAFDQDSTNFYYNKTNGKLSVHAGTPNAAYNTAYFQVGPSSADIGSYDPQLSPVVITSKTTNGGSTPAAAEPVAIWMRQGVAGQSYANIVDWKISRSINSGTNANTKLDLGLTGGGGDATSTTVMSWSNENGSLKTNFPGLTASSLVATDSSKNLVSTNTLSSTVLGNIPKMTLTVLTSGDGLTYTTPAGVTHLVITMCASGGSGAGVAASASNAGAASGGGGGWLKRYIANPAATYTYTVGAAVAGGAAGANPGSNGNTTTFGALTANGGSAGAADTSSINAHIVQGGLGGSASGGDINLTGSSGGPGITISSSVSLGGYGGPSQMGGLIRGPLNANGANGLTPCGGGAGAASNNATSRAGGDSGRGEIDVEEYYNG